MISRYFRSYLCFFYDVFRTVIFSLEFVQKVLFAAKKSLTPILVDLSSEYIAKNVSNMT